MASPSELRLLHAIRAIQEQYIEDASPDEVFESLLAALLAITESEYGFIGEVRRTEEGAPFMKAWAITNIAWDDATQRFYDENAPSGMEFYNLETLFGAVMTTGEAVVSNEPSNDPRRGGLPPGHPPLNAFLGVPLRHRDEMIGMIGVANRPSGYDAELVEFLQPFLATCATILRAYRTDRAGRQMQHELDDKEERRHLIAEVSSDGSFIIDVEPGGSRSIWADEGVERITGFDLDDFKKLDWGTVIHSEDAAWVARAAEQTPFGETNRAEFRIVRKDGSMRWVHRAERRYPRGEGGLRVVGALHDVTERVESELERRRVEEDLRHMQKIDAIGTLAGGVAHDFNNVLYVILGNAELALKKLDESHPARKNVSEALSAARRGADITNRILQYSQVGAMSQGSCDVGEVMSETKEFLVATLPSSTLLVFDGDPDGIFVPVGASDLQQVIVNLCTNASHAMPEGGEVHVEFDASADQGVRIAVRDAGQGMSESLLQHVFEPYFTTKPRGKGTGLGLSVVQGIVKAAGGAIEVESRVGEGTTMSLWLPKATAPEAEQPPAADVGEGRESVLFGDDEPRVARLGQEILESLGYTVEAMTSSKVALERFGEDPARFDIIVTDQTMPHLTGDAFAREILRIRPDMPIVLCTGFSERLDGGGWGEIGIHSFLKKPFGLEQLGSTVRRALDETKGASWPKSSS